MYSTTEFCYSFKGDTFPAIALAYSYLYKAKSTDRDEVVFIPSDSFIDALFSPTFWAHFI